MVLKNFTSEDYQNMEELRQALEWNFWTEGGPVDEVRGIISEVERGGDAALFELTERLDGVRLQEKGFRVGREDIEKACRRIERPFAEAVKAAIKNINAFHRHQTWESQFWESDEGARVGQMARPLKRVGIYIPGGSGAYPSTAIMTVIPAKVAGVQEVVVCVPPGPDGEINSPTLFALDLMGIEEIYRVGGAQAVAAMAVGTESIKAVDKIVGPGNVYVTLAKREVFGRVGIDMLAGPSELVVLADGEEDIEFLAYDILAQLEHGAGARACLISFDRKTIKGIEKKLRETLDNSSPRQAYNASAVLVRSLKEAIDLVNTLAPEHLLISTRSDMTGVLSKIHSAGAVFLGVESPVALGDYAVGVNHVLPTAGAARYASPLSVYDFIKRSNIVFSNPRANRSLGVVVEALARVEGFMNHAESMQKRT
jgi:histidinol dehydrogenase